MLEIAKAILSSIAASLFIIYASRAGNLYRNESPFEESSELAPEMIGYPRGPESTIN